MKISTTFDQESEEAFHEGDESILIIHAAANLLLYRGLGYPFAVRGMLLLPVQMEISGNVKEVFIREIEDIQNYSLELDGWKEALRHCSRVTLSFFVNGRSEPEHARGYKAPRFGVRIRLFEKGKRQSFYMVDMLLIKVRLPAVIWPVKEDGPDYRLEGSMRYQKG